MRTIVVASGKGGTLKSSLVASLGVYAAGEAKTALIDLNADQATLTRWWKARGEPANPFLVEEIEGQLHHELRALDKIKRVHCLIDTPPDEMKTIEVAVFDATAVLIPVRASELDIEASKAIVDMCQRRRKPYAFVLVAVDNRPAARELNKQARAELGKLGDSVLKAVWPYSVAAVQGMAKGKAGQEADSGLMQHVRGIWDETKTIGAKQ
jgi:chromosome partitioning protein